MTEILEEFFKQVEAVEKLPKEERRSLYAQILAGIPLLELLADAVPGGNAERWALDYALVRAAALEWSLLDWETPWYGPFPPEGLGRQE